MKIFLSYTSADRAWAQWIGVTLRDAGHEMSVHEWEVAAGENIPAWMEERLGRADKMIGVFSPAYVEAVHSNSERWAAYWHDPGGRKGFLIPIEVAPLADWPIFAKNLRRLSLVGKSQDGAARDLVAFLEPPGPPKERPTFPGPPDAMSQLGSGGGEGRPRSADFADAAPFAAGSPDLPTTAPTFPPADPRLQEIGTPRVLSSHTRLEGIEPSAIDDEAALRIWFAGQPRSVAMVMSVRAALRVVPLLERFHWALEKGSSEDALLPLLRGVAAPWALVILPAHGATFKAASSAIAGEAAKSAALALPPTPTSSPATAAATAAAAVAAAANSVDTLAIAAASSASAAYAAAGFSSSHFPATVWAQLRADAMTLGDVPSVVGLANRPLWDGAETDTWGATFKDVLAQAWSALKRRLLELDPNWSVWTDWWEARRDGRPADEEKELARLTLPEEMWQAGAKVANAEIRRRFEEIDARRAAAVVRVTAFPAKPSLPSPEIGTDYRVGDEGLQTRPGPRVADPATRLERLHARLAREVIDLVALSKKVGNSHPRLLRVVAEYAECFQKGFADLDLDHLWDTGLSLVEMSSVFDRDGLPADERLAAEHQGLLNVVVAQHASLVHAIPELGARAAGAEKMRARMSIFVSVARPMATVLDRFADAEQGVESKTRQFLKAVAAGFEATSGDHYEAAHSAYTNVTNILIRVGEHLDRIDEATPEGMRGVLEAVVDGDPENTRALVRLFGDCEAEIRAFAGPFPALKAWIDWIYLRLDRLKKL